MLIVKIVLTAILLLGVVNPALSIKLTESWKFNRKPPSERVFKITRLYSALAIVIVWVLL